MSIRRRFLGWTTALLVAGLATAGLSSVSAAPVGVRNVNVGSANSCAVYNDNSVKCWGAPIGERMDDEPTQFATRPQTVPNLSAISVSLNYQHACALTAGRRVACWGDNAYGRVGQPVATTSVATPTFVPGLSDVQSVTTGREHSCALLLDGTVRCWGRNTFGQLGTGGSANSVPTPVSPRNLSDVVSIAAGAASTCAVTNSGRVWCWGWGHQGELGNATRLSSKVPVMIRSLKRVVSVFSAQSTFCAIKADTTGWCWGAGWFGQLGNGSELSYTTSPVQIADLEGITSISVDQESACAVTSDGSVYCWGSNRQNQLGDGTKTNSSVPILVSLPNAARGVAVGQQHACAALPASIRCWGLNTYGQLGNGSTTSSEQPSLVEQ